LQLRLSQRSRAGSGHLAQRTGGKRPPKTGRVSRRGRCNSGRAFTIALVRLLEVTITPLISRANGSIVEHRSTCTARYVSSSSVQGRRAENRKKMLMDSQKSPRFRSLRSQRKSQSSLQLRRNPRSRKGRGATRGGDGRQLTAPKQSSFRAWDGQASGQFGLSLTPTRTLR
jgi:hypothetical protein